MTLLYMMAVKISEMSPPSQESVGQMPLLTKEEIVESMESYA